MKSFSNELPNTNQVADIQAQLDAYKKETDQRVYACYIVFTLLGLVEVATLVLTFWKH